MIFYEACGTYLYELGLKKGLTPKGAPKGALCPWL